MNNENWNTEQSYIDQMNQRAISNFNGQPAMKKADVVTRSITLSRAITVENSMLMQNAPTDPEKRVEVDAALRMARDATRKAKELYDNAFEAWAREGYQE